MRIKIAITALLFVVFALVAALMLPTNAPAQLEGVTNLNGLHLSQTSFGTATPQLLVQNGGSGVSVEVRNGSATPVFKVGSTGGVTGQVLKYSTAGTQIVCGTQTITDTANVVHGLTTPIYGLCALNQTLTGDAFACNATVSGITVTVKVRNTAATPTANSAGASVNWCVIGTP